MVTTGSILPFVKRTSRDGAQLHANSNKQAQHSSGKCPHCGGLLLPGETANECSSAPRDANPVLRKRDTAPSCAMIASGGRSVG